MKTYVADRAKRGTDILVVEGEKERRLLPDLSLKYRNHSPDGFEWGYGGSGPSQLALGILLDVLGENAWPVIQGLYHYFKFDFIAKANRDGFILTEEQIRDWVCKKTEVTSAV